MIILFMLFFAFWASWMAPRKGKSGPGAFVLGFFFGLLEIVYLASQRDV
jgi:hypothetical protein